MATVRVIPDYRANIKLFADGLRDDYPGLLMLALTIPAAMLFSFPLLFFVSAILIIIPGLIRSYVS